MGIFDQFYKKPEFSADGRRFAAAPEAYADRKFGDVVQDLLANKVSLFHSVFQLDGVPVGLVLVAGADTARLMKLVGNALAAGLVDTEKAQPKAAKTGPMPKDKT